MLNRVLEFLQKKSRKSFVAVSSSLSLRFLLHKLNLRLPRLSVYVGHGCPVVVFPFLWNVADVRGWH